MTTVRKQGTFRAQHAEKTRRAAQRTALPPRCENCRLPGTIAVEHDGITHFYCKDHVPMKENERVGMTRIKAIAYSCNNCGKEQVVREEHDVIGIVMKIAVRMPTYGDGWDAFLCNWDCAIAYAIKQRDGRVGDGS